MRFFVSLRLWIISMLLAAAAIFFGYQAYMVWHKDTPAVGKPVQKPLKSRADRKIVYRRNLPIAAYEVIANKNLFSNDRKEKLPDKPPPTLSRVIAAKPLDRRFALFGVIIAGDQKEALVSNIAKKSAKEKETIWVKVGDKIGDLNVAEIQAEQIIITRGGSTYTVRLSDPNKYKKRSVTRKRSKQKDTRIQKELEPKTKNLSDQDSDESS